MFMNNTFSKAFAFMKPDIHNIIQQIHIYNFWRKVIFGTKIYCLFIKVFSGLYAHCRQY